MSFEYNPFELFKNDLKTRGNSLSKRFYREYSVTCSPSSKHNSIQRCIPVGNISDKNQAQKFSMGLILSAQLLPIGDTNIKIGALFFKKLLIVP